MLEDPEGAGDLLSLTCSGLRVKTAYPQNCGKGLSFPNPWADKGKSLICDLAGEVESG